MTKKYVVLASALIIQTCLGGVYAWSTFVAPLVESHGLRQAQTQVIFGFTIATFTIAMVFAGRLQQKYGPRPVAAIGGILFGTGYLIASISKGAFPILLLGIGVTSGAGIGFGYVCPLATCVKWFPKHKGFITGLAVAGFGGGAVLLSFMANSMFEAGHPVLTIFKYIGISYGLAVIIAAMFLTNPPQFQTDDASASSVNVTNVIRTRAFWTLVLGIFAGTFAGLMVIGNLKPIGISKGISATAATFAISAFAIGNAAGRISWGIIVDKIAHKAIFASLIFLAIAIAALLIPAPAAWLFVTISALIGFGFGACFVVYTAQTAAYYGPYAVGSIYPIIFLAYGFSGIAGPTIGGEIYDKTGTYYAAIITAAAMAALVAILIPLISKGQPTALENQTEPQPLAEQT